MLLCPLLCCGPFPNSRNGGGSGDELHQQSVTTDPREVICTAVRRRWEETRQSDLQSERWEQPGVQGCTAHALTLIAGAGIMGRELLYGTGSNFPIKVCSMKHTDR